MTIRILIAALLLAGAWGGSQWLSARHWEAEALKERQSASAQRLRADGCAGRIQSILDDKESDHEVDHMRDLTNVPERWLMPQ